MTRDFIVTSKQLEGSITFYFDEMDRLRGYLVEGEPTDEQLQWLRVNAKALESPIVLKQFFKNIKGSQVVEKPMDLSFDTFWKTYNYKEGNKQRAIKLWNALSETQRARAIAGIKKYNDRLSQRANQERAYPETWLYQRRWESMEG